MFTLFVEWIQPGGAIPGDSETVSAAFPLLPAQQESAHIERASDNRAHLFSHGGIRFSACRPAWTAPRILVHLQTWSVSADRSCFHAGRARQRIPSFSMAMIALDASVNYGIPVEGATWDELPQETGNSEYLCPAVSRRLSNA
jgi:hypothetical protein